MLSHYHGLQVWPFYFLCDESASMSGAPINEVNESLQKIWTELIKSPAAADKAWVSVISFSDTAEVLVPLTDLQKLTSMPGCVAGGGANYHAAFLNGIAWNFLNLCIASWLFWRVRRAERGAPVRV